ncbi:type VII secretion protein EssC [Leifsonia sp. 22587]|uniref:type VII secretion protein EssC n=1 Tax=Leifsonia sp. 22587 TaxID=3453946 RepID=UPI003F8243E7
MSAPAVDDTFGTSTMSEPSDRLIDDRLEPETVLFVVHMLGERLISITLTEDRRSAVRDGLTIGVINDRLFVNGEAVSPGIRLLAGIELLIVDARLARTTHLQLNMTEDTVLGKSSAATVRTSSSGGVAVVVRNDALVVDPAGGLVYLNDRRITEPELLGPLKPGDRLLTPEVLLERRPSQWRLTTFAPGVEVNEAAVLRQPKAPEFPPDFPEYRRSPRISLELPTEKIELRKIEPPQKPDRNGILKALLPPLGMVAVGVVTTVLSGRNPLLMLGMALMSIITAAFTVSTFVSERRARQRQKAVRRESYERYLLDAVASLGRLSALERRVRDHALPAPDAAIDLVDAYDSRIYERLPNNRDFLEVSLGTGDIPSSLTITSDVDERDDDHDARRVAELVARHATQRQVPMPLSLRSQTIGLVGGRDAVTTAAAGLLFQLAVFHSYRDLQFLALVDEPSYREEWLHWRFLPHFTLHDLNLRGIVRNAKTRDMVLGSFTRILARRRQALRESTREKPVFAPHYVLTVLDDTHLAGHAINEYLAEDMSALGVTVIWCTEDRTMLPETVTALIEYRNRSAGTLVNDGRVHVALGFVPYARPRGLERALRRLSNLTHVEVEKNAIPTAVSFLEMYQVEEVEHLEVGRRWSEADTSKTLAVPLGLRGKDDLVELNLHERAHGPHGLVAGTTGSGKSEIVQSYILSLAVNFAPEDVGFLPIDFKGGGMANMFAGLPHLLGSITNLDGAASARALASIRAELQKRQRLFGEYGVNHINGYTRLYKLGRQEGDPIERKNYPARPLPHLFLISDEFAELKANQPEFMEELVSTARIGRSLGVHLILATQKPSGVVNDQIWSNSRFKLALKVADVTDSNEIIKTPDAAGIVEPGRAYLHVGNNEIYELFQSAWSGAAYDPGSADTSAVDERIYRVNDVGQYDLWTRDLSGEETIREARGDRVSELRAVVAHLAEVAQGAQAVLPDRPWLPPLDGRLTTPAVGEGPGVPLGRLDVPRRQSQETYVFALEEASHLAVFGSPGYGASTVLQTLVMNLARQRSPLQVQFTLLDFGNNGLLPLQRLPHVADLVTLEEHEKLRKALDRIGRVLGERKRQLRTAGVANAAQFAAKTGEELPVIVTVLDGYDAIAQDKRKEAIDAQLIQLLREGAALGVHLVMTANRANSLRMNMSSNIPTKMALYLNDEADVAALFGRERVVQAEILGRGQLLLEAPTAIQFYLPAEGANDTEVLDALDREVARRDAEWTGERPARIPMVPDELPLSDFGALPQVADWTARADLPLAMSCQTTDVVGLVRGAQPFFLCAAADEDQEVILQRTLLHALAATGARTVLADHGQRFEDLAELVHDVGSVIWHDKPDDAAQDAALLTEYLHLGGSRQRGEPQMLVIADLAHFVHTTRITPDVFVSSLRPATRAGLDVVIFSPHAYIAKSFDPVPKGLRELKFGGLIGARAYESPLIRTGGLSTEPDLHPDQVHLVSRGGSAYDKVKLPSG